MDVKCLIKGYKAYPICGDWLRSMYSKNLNKNIHFWHRQFLPEDQPLCQQRQARHFNGKVEIVQLPILMMLMDWHIKQKKSPIIDPESEIASDGDDVEY